MKKIDFITLILLVSLSLIFMSSIGFAEEAPFPPDSFTISTKGGPITVTAVKKDNNFPYLINDTPNEGTNEDPENNCPDGVPTCLAAVWELTGDGVNNISSSSVKLPRCLDDETIPMGFPIGGEPIPLPCLEANKTDFLGSCSDNTYNISFTTTNMPQKRFYIYFEYNEANKISSGPIDIAITVGNNVYYGVILGPACKEFCPKPDYSTNTIQTTKYLNTNDPDVEVEVLYAYNLETGCIAQVFYRIVPNIPDPDQPWIPAEVVEPEIDVGDGTELMIECGDSEGNQYCRTCQFTTSRNPTCTYIRSGGLTSRVCW